MNLIGKTVHVRDASPRGWIGTVRSLSGSVYIIVDQRGVWHMVDHTRREVTPL
ncbi:hypothetical protein MINTM005_13060 [Mycobacterium intracellulare]|uniref:DUF7393 domain-containing protein n=1 Tax=Mycobacterium intracellulare TaxID=1767 RepID=UPI0019296F15|nr:hypothetical protein [Mycobacterium intracellulare]BCO56062.1 hypothetical protein MINTM005_13060 [Mycobacterium intracellulare]